MQSSKEKITEPLSTSTVLTEFTKLMSNIICSTECKIVFTKNIKLTRDVMTGCNNTLLQEAVLAVHCAAAGFTSVQL